MEARPIRSRQAETSIDFGKRMIAEIKMAFEDFTNKSHPATISIPRSPGQTEWDLGAIVAAIANFCCSIRYKIREFPV